jgi:5-formyltetrahydrofolate cyclo-ligase
MSLAPEDVIRRKVKAELRKRMRALRNTAPASTCLERSQRIIERVQSVNGFSDAKRLALFWPIEAKHEVDLRGLDASLRGRGAEVFYPTIDPQTGKMTFRAAAPEALQEAGYGFREPAPTAPEATTLDVIVVPALAVDGRGHRLGYGAGYYDRTIPRFAPPARTIVVAYDYQLIVEVPVTDGDVACDVIVTDERTIIV